MIRFYDILLSIVILLLSLPFIIIIALAITMESGGGVIFKQIRVGQGDKDFTLFKFRTMYTGSHLKTLLTIGEKDSRITKVGYFLRKYKLDELPQFLNVIKGEMSIVGPRPEVRKYVEKYTEGQRQILTVKPGITDYASIYYRHENTILSGQQDPETYYITQIMPHKILLSRKTTEKIKCREYLKIIWLTICSV